MMKTINVFNITALANNDILYRIHVYIVCTGLDTRRRSLYAVGATESDMQRSSVDDMIYVTVDNDSYNMQDHDHGYAASEALY